MAAKVKFGIRLNIQGEIRRVQFPTGKPAIKTMFILGKNCFRKFIPLYLLSLFPPEKFRLF